MNITKILREWGLILVIIIITIVATIIRPAFLSLNNIMNILRAYSTIGIVSIGMTFAVICGGMDLAVGSTISLTSVVTMMILNRNIVGSHSPAYSLFIVILIALSIGAIIGLANGVIIASINGRMGESFIITFAMQVIIAATATATINGQFQPAHYTSGLIKQMGIGMNPILLFILVAVIMQLILTKTMFGRYMYFLGANMNAAKMAGIKIANVRIIAHIFCGACAGLAGVLIVARVNSASPLQGIGYELDALAAVAVGGTSLAGGTGSVIKTVMGVFVIGVLLTALNILGVRSDAQLIARGTIIVLAIILDSWNKRSVMKEAAK